jgi:glutamate synthase domain-containing protein 1
LEVLYWRDLSTNAEHIGIEAQACEPYCVQVFVKRKMQNEQANEQINEQVNERANKRANDNSTFDDRTFEQQLYLVRKEKCL